MGSQEKSTATNNSMQRVKVYRLSNDGKWDDQGTGHVTVDYLERSEELGLFVIDEEDNETLLLHRISSDDVYRKQDDTIISWRDPEFSTELALSFQETTGCSYIWDQICSAQRNLHFNALNDETYRSVNSELRELPAVELSTLPLILKNVVEGGIADQMRVTELILRDQDFFRKLMDLFRICEDLENIDGLHMIFKIVRGIILLNSPQVFEKIFGDELIMDIIGSLEYDPDILDVRCHRRFLKEHVVFKEAMPIKNPAVLSKIHQTYRVGYLKDVILPRVLDDATMANLSSIIHSNNAIVVSLLKDDSTFIQELFARLRSSTIPAESKRNWVLFLHEFCSLSKSLQMTQQHRLFRDLVNEGIFNIVADVLKSQDKKLVLTGTDILILFLNQDPNLLRSYITQQEGIPLLGLLVKGLITDFGDDMHCQFLEILRSLLDSYTSGSQRDTILDIFYEKHLGQLIDVITSSCHPNSVGQSVSKSVDSYGSAENQSRAKPEILLNICELLCFCVLHHPYRIKDNFLLNNVIDKILFLTHRREKYLVVAAVRFFRTLISRNDEHLMNHIVKSNLLKPIVEAFVDNGSRYNLLNSAVLELFEYVRKENLKILLKYLVDSFWNQLVKFENLATIYSLKIKYEQSLENSGTRSSIDVLDSRKRIDERALEKEEEDYFNDDSDEEDSASASMSHSPRVQARPILSNGSAASYPLLSPRAGGLVDYADDEDDEDYKPPPRKQPEIPDGDEGTVESFRLKRKLALKEEPELIKKQRTGKNSKSNDNVFAALCSTISQAVLPSQKAAHTVHPVPRSPDLKTSSDEENHPNEENHTRKEPTSPRSCSDSLHPSSDNRQLSGEDCPLIPPTSSPEMTVNGS
ncbi:Serine/threonine-protein phosphatase 4 regulatory subunit like [Actinidia chinensis var. chinensis]|uniref:Serine/threonine-protein phosphatase 4 regulatory subunit like n=1 Tax=Actinidia chinensis var. chinensis TaxID=1590841 RepID=A0A2R6Q495_ACTCC|nr:Serine/threonine-protein phosphatase 4 regulatory subunit like [Actinidia chinensis var. chinensis]